MDSQFMPGCNPIEKTAFSIKFLLMQLCGVLQNSIINKDNLREIDDKLKEIILLNEEAIDEDITPENSSTLRFEAQICSSYPGKGTILYIAIKPIIAGDCFILVPPKNRMKEIFMPL